ncbi:MAG: hypothetical protein U1E34_02735 [Amaricoccus sp.]
MRAALAVEVGSAALLLLDAAVDFGSALDAEIVVDFEPPATIGLHVYGREIADGALTCSLGPRRAAVRMDLALAARIVAEALRAGLRLPDAEADGLRTALGQGEEHVDGDQGRNHCHGGSDI